MTTNTENLSNSLEMIEALINQSNIEFIEIVKKLKHCNEILKQFKDPQVMNDFNNLFLASIRIRDRLKTQIKFYFDEERKVGNVRNLALRREYKAITA